MKKRIKEVDQFIKVADKLLRSRSLEIEEEDVGKSG